MYHYVTCVLLFGCVYMELINIFSISMNHSTINCQTRYKTACLCIVLR